MGLSSLHSLIQEKIHIIREYYKNEGFLKLVLYLFSRIGIIIKREYIFSEFNLRDTIPSHNNNCHLDMDFVWVKKNDFEHFNFPTEEGWLTKNEASRRLSGTNSILFALTKGKNIICYVWHELTLAHLPFLGLFFSMPDKTAYSLALYTVPEFRGKGLAAKLKLLQLQFLKNKGYKKEFFVIRSNNIASQKVVKKLGYKAYQTVIYRKVFFIKYYCVKDYDTNKQKRFWYIKKQDQKLWKHFSKISDY